MDLKIAAARKAENLKDDQFLIVDTQKDTHYTTRGTNSRPAIMPTMVGNEIWDCQVALRDISNDAERHRFIQSNIYDHRLNHYNLRTAKGNILGTSGSFEKILMMRSFNSTKNKKIWERYIAKDNDSSGCFEI